MSSQREEQARPLVAVITLIIGLAALLAASGTFYFWFSLLDSSAESTSARVLTRAFLYIFSGLPMSAASVVISCVALHPSHKAERAWNYYSWALALAILALVMAGATFIVLVIAFALAVRQH